VNERDAQNVRVIKLGGSLLELPDLPAVLRGWLTRQPAMSNVVLVGGGRLADVVRDYDRLHSLSELDSHWLAIRAMELNGRLMAPLMPEAQWLDSLVEEADRMSPLTERKATMLAILNPYRFMQNDQQSRQPLPASWQVTSDSIAARAAEHTCASELVLLKSALPPAPGTIDAALKAGYVDRYFPIVSRRLPEIRCVNLRDETFPEVIWHGDLMHTRNQIGIT
jgi:5-(aminomethyl)-3-furanmethanol phosphate kinase